MEGLLQKILDNQLQDLVGTRLAGQIVLSDELVNEVMNGMLGQLTGESGTTNVKTTPSSETSPGPDPKTLLSLLTIDKLHYRTEKGKTIVEINAGI